MKIPLKKIVIVEDDHDICTVVAMLLKKYGDIDVVACDSPCGLLSVVKDESPQLLILDMMLPGKTGLDALKEMRNVSEFANVPALFLTAYKIHFSEEEKRALGIIGVIRKPFEPHTLYEQIIKLYEEY